MTAVMARQNVGAIEEGLAILAGQGGIAVAKVVGLVEDAAVRTGRSVSELCRLAIAGDLRYEHLGLTAPS